VDTLTTEILGIITSFSQGQVTGIGAASAALYLFIRVAQGRAGFRVPYVSAWLDARTPVQKIAIVAVLGAGGGVLASSVTGGWALPVILGGLVKGAVSAVGAFGLHNTINHVEKAATKPRPPIEATPPGAAGPVEG